MQPISALGPAHGPAPSSAPRALPELAVPRAPEMSPKAEGDVGDILGDTGLALSQALLCVTSLGCALRARKVTGGPAAGFLLQALAAATDALSPPCPRDVPDVPAPPSGSWICTVLAQPLVAFGCHRLSGDAATANLLLAAATSVAAVAWRWPEDGRVLAGHFVTALTAGSLLALAALTGSVAGAVAAASVALGDAVTPRGVPWVRAAGGVALLGTLREQSGAWRDQ